MFVDCHLGDVQEKKLDLHTWKLFMTVSDNYIYFCGYVIQETHRVHN